MKEILERLRSTWDELDPPWIKWAIPAVVAVGLLVFYFNHQKNIANQEKADEAKLLKAYDKAKQGTNPSIPGRPNVNSDRINVLPNTNRNQGLEDMAVRFERLEARLGRFENGSKGAGGATKPNAANAAAVDLTPPSPTNGNGGAGSGTSVDMNSPAPVSFDQQKTSKTDASAPDAAHAGGASPTAQPATKRRPKARTWKEESASATTESQNAPTKVIPTNSALESVMLSGMNALPSGAAMGGAAGAVRSALNIGTPFVTRIKGNAILPNGWKADDLDNCFLGGSGIAVLSAERTNVIAATMTCIDNEGVLWEGDVTAYGLDADGTMGIACRVVNKQGSILMQSALTGMASGLGQALTPTAIPMYNQNATAGSSQGGAYPSASFAEQSMLGQGISNATAQLSKFYLQFASQTLPVCESTAGTRVTWVLKKSIELKAKGAKS